MTESPSIKERSLRYLRATINFFVSLLVLLLLNVAFFEPSLQLATALGIVRPGFSVDGQGMIGMVFSGPLACFLAWKYFLMMAAKRMRWQVIGIGGAAAIAISVRTFYRYFVF